MEGVCRAGGSPTNKKQRRPFVEATQRSRQTGT